MAAREADMLNPASCRGQQPIAASRLTAFQKNGSFFRPFRASSGLREISRLVAFLMAICGSVPAVGGVHRPAAHALSGQEPSTYEELMTMASKKKAKTSNKNLAGNKKVRLRTLKDPEILKEQAQRIKGGFTPVPIPSPR
jgi:hypothetical protein